MKIPSIFVLSIMKRFIAALIFILYFLSSSGATFHLHFCMNEFAGLSLNSEKDTPLCSYCGMDKTKAKKHSKKTAKDCCKDKEVSLKVKSDHRVSSVIVHMANDTHSIVAVPVPTACQSYTYNTITTPVNNGGPPVLRKVPLFVLNAVFRI